MERNKLETNVLASVCSAAGEKFLCCVVSSSAAGENFQVLSEAAPQAKIFCTVSRAVGEKNFCVASRAAGEKLKQ